MKVSDLNKIIEETISEEIKNTILNEQESGKKVFCILNGDEYVEICDTEDEANKKCEEYNKQHPGNEFTVKMETYESQEDLFDKLDELGEEIDQNDMKEDQSMEEQLETNEAQEQCSECGDNGLEITEATCEKCGKSICECGEINESKKQPRKILRLTESQLVDMIEKMVNESVPGLKAVEDAQKINDKETKEHMGNVDKKIKDTLSIEGNDNPEFPKQVGKGGPDVLDPKKTVNNTDEQDEEMSMDRGEAALDLDYDTEPSEEFKDRVKKALEGDSTMGNADGGNTVKTDTGKNLQKTAEKRKKYKEEAPMYVKDVQPVNEEKEDESKKVLSEEIEKMKKLSSYNEKTQ